jgi:hypothetical protein
MAVEGVGEEVKKIVVSKGFNPHLTEHAFTKYAWLLRVLVRK